MSGDDRLPSLTTTGGAGGFDAQLEAVRGLAAEYDAAAGRHERRLVQARTRQARHYTRAREPVQLFVDAQRLGGDDLESVAGEHLVQLTVLVAGRPDRSTVSLAAPARIEGRP